MSWDIVGNIGEAVSAIALLFVLVQVRHARAEMRRSVSQNRADVSREIFLLSIENPQFASLLSRVDAAMGALNPDFDAALARHVSVSPEEAAQVESFMRALWVHDAQVIAYIDELRAGERTQFDHGLRSVFGGGLGKLWYQMMKRTLDPDAVRYVDAVLATPSTGGQP